MFFVELFNYDDAKNGPRTKGAMMAPKRLLDPIKDWATHRGLKYTINDMEDIIEGNFIDIGGMISTDSEIIDIHVGLGSFRMFLFHVPRILQILEQEKLRVPNKPYPAWMLLPAHPVPRCVSYSEAMELKAKLQTYREIGELRSHQFIHNASKAFRQQRDNDESHTA